MFFVHFIHRMLSHAVLTGLANVEIRYFITTWDLCDILSFKSKKKKKKKKKKKNTQAC